MQFGGSSVDTWVMSSQPSSTFTLLPSPMQPADLARKHRTVSSRAAENLFWAGRYGERAENNVRLLRLILGSLEGNEADAMFPDAGRSRPAMRPRAIRRRELSKHSPHAFERRSSRIWANTAPRRASGRTWRARRVRVARYAGGCRTITGARSSPPATISATHCRRSSPPQPAGRPDRVALMKMLEYLATQLSAISGAQGDRMTRDEAWRLLFAGRHIERLSTMATFLRTVVEHRQLASPACFDLLLELFDSTLTYRSHVSGALRGAGADRPAGGRAGKPARAVRRVRAPVQEARRDLVRGGQHASPAVRGSDAFVRDAAGRSKHSAPWMRRASTPP